MWSEIARLANAGQVDEAMELAKETERSGEIQFKNTMTRRLRIERIAWFARVNRGEKDLKTLFNDIGTELGNFVEKNGTKTANIPKINDKIHEMMIAMRVTMRSWINSMVRDSIRISLRNQGDAIRPIFKDSQEAFEETMQEFSSLDDIIDLFEANRVVSVKTSLANREPGVKLSTPKWKLVQKAVLKKIMKKNVFGLQPSQKIWEITTRAEATLRRVISTEIASGTSSATIARKTKKFISPAKIAEAQELGLRGVYASPFKNAMRLARTETNRAYAKASGEFAKNKTWITGQRFNLSPIHNISDECDSWSNVVVSVEEYNDMVDSGQFPFHPHCRCFVTSEIDDKFLEKEEAA
jgi:hypothetical protein